MDQKAFEQRVLDQDLTEQDLRRDPACAQEVASDPAKQNALEQMDAIRQALGHGDQDDDLPEPPGGWPAFEDRLARAAASRCGGLGGGGSGPRLIMAWLGWVAAAAAIAVAALSWSHRLDDGVLPARSLTAAAAVPVAMLPTPSELHDRLRMFREINRDFDHRTHWVAMADDHADLGLGQALEDPGRLIVMRLTLQTPEMSEPLSQVDLIIIAGQQAVVTVPLDSGMSATYRIDTMSAGADRRPAIAVWAELHGRGEHREIYAALAARLVHDAGRVQTVGQMVNKGRHYVLGIGFGQTDGDEAAPQSRPSNKGGTL